MALKRIESFDHLSTQAQLVAKPGWAASGTITLEAAAGRRSTRNLRTNGSNGCSATLSMPASHASGVVGFAFSTDSLNTGFSYIRILDSGAVVHLDLRVNASQQLEIRRGTGGTLLATGTTALNINTYYYCEIKFTIDDASGAIELRLNGNTTPEFTFAGDTRNGGNASWLSIQFRGQELSASSPFIRFDDIYVCDGAASGVSGLPNNDFLGDLRIDCFNASSGNGTNTGMTPSTGTDHGALVDETTPNDDTDYNSGISVGDKDTYNFPNLSFAPATIYGVQGNNYLKKTDAGARSICNVMRSNGTDYDKSDQALSTSYAYYGDMFESDPDTGAAWTPSAVNALEFGAKVTV